VFIRHHFARAAFLAQSVGCSMMLGFRSIGLQE
jgi:hypothetical protein